MLLLAFIALVTIVGLQSLGTVTNSKYRVASNAIKDAGSDPNGGGNPRNPTPGAGMPGQGNPGSGNPGQGGGSSNGKAAPATITAENHRIQRFAVTVRWTVGLVAFRAGTHMDTTRDNDDSRRSFLKKAAYTAPLILTLKAEPAFASYGSGKPVTGNNGVGNGVDPQPPGNPPVNDGPGTGPGAPGNRH